MKKDSSGNTGGDSESEEESEEEADESDIPPELVHSGGGESSEEEGTISLQPSRRRGLRKRRSGPRRRRRRGEDDLEDEGSDRDISEEDRVNGGEENIVNVQIGAPPNPPLLPLPAAQQQQGDGLQLGGQAQGELLQTRIRPVLPVPERMVEDAEVDADGWSVIDCLGAWDSKLVKFAMMQEIPVQHQEVWVEAFSRVLQMIEDADDDQKMTRALKWMCFLPQALLRKPSRGGKSGRGLGDR